MGCSQEATELGAKVIAISGPDGVIYNPNGMTDEKINYMLELRSSNRNIVAPFAEKFKDATFTPGKKAWSVKCDIALPCAFQNELNGDDAAELLKNVPGAAPRFPTWDVLRKLSTHSRKQASSSLRARPLTQVALRLPVSNDAELHAPLLVGQGSGRKTPHHHGEHPRSLRRVRQAARRLHQLREGCEHRRLHESRSGNARTGYHLIHTPHTKKGEPKRSPFFFVAAPARRYPKGTVLFASPPALLRTDISFQRLDILLERSPAVRRDAARCTCLPPYELLLHPDIARPGELVQLYAEIPRRGTGLLAEPGKSASSTETSSDITASLSREWSSGFNSRNMPSSLYG